MTTDSQNNTSETLRQGAKFKKYQNKIINSVAKKHKKLLEGFESSSNIEKSQNLINQANQVQNAAQELQQLQTQFIGLLGRYQTANTQLMTTTNSYLNAPSNAAADPTIGKNVFVNSIVTDPTSKYIGAYADNAATPAMTKVTTSSVGYTFADCQQAALAAGKQFFGLQNADTTSQTGTCSTSNTLSQAEKYGVAGPNCSQKSDGYIYGGGSTNALYKTPSAEYIGTYVDSPNRAMTLVNGGSQTYSYQTCMQEAIQSGSAFFGLQDILGAGPGSAQCAISNNWMTASQYGTTNNFIVASDGHPYGGGWANSIYETLGVAQYQGCYKDLAPNRTMESLNGGASTSDFAQCQTAAINGNYGYFALQDGGPGTAQCFLSNSLTESTQYGVSTPTTTLNDGNAYGNTLVNAVYQLNSMGNLANMGKLGNVNNSGLLSEYPTSMINTTNGVPSIVNSDNSCSKDIINIDSIQWGNYKQTGNEMSPSTKCGLGTAIQADQSSANELGYQLEIMSARIIWLINYLESLDSSIIAQTGINKASLDDMLTQYKSYNSIFSQYKSNEVKNINGILTDSNIVATHENYSYILWSVLAISVIIVTVSLIRRNK